MYNAGEAVPSYRQMHDVMKDLLKRNDLDIHHTAVKDLMEKISQVTRPRFLYQVL